VTRPKVDSRICVVVPTVRRNRNGFQYLNETLDRHRKVLASSLFLDRFLYLSESDIEAPSRSPGSRGGELRLVAVQSVPGLCPQHEQGSRIVGGDVLHVARG
jgi:hypothetical protein